MMQPSRMRALVVDDNTTDRLIVKAILRKMRFLVIHEAENGAVAEAKLVLASDMSEPYDVILLDWNMPRAGGIKVLKIIRSHPKLKSAKVIIMTASSKLEIVEEAIAAGTDDFIVKPVESDLLVKKLETAFNAK